MRYCEDHAVPAMIARIWRKQQLPICVMGCKWRTGATFPSLTADQLDVETHCSAAVKQHELITEPFNKPKCHAYPLFTKLGVEVR